MPLLQNCDSNFSSLITRKYDGIIGLKTNEPEEKIANIIVLQILLVLPKSRDGFKAVICNCSRSIFGKNAAE